MRTVPGRTDHVVVVGAGLSGLSAALHLLGAGREVTLLERTAGPGGCAGRLDVDGFRIDTGPTVLTMPHLLDQAFAAVGESARERLDLVELSPAYRAAFADGTALDVHTGAEAMAVEVARVAGPREAAGYLRLRGWLRRMYDLQMRRFIDANFDSPLDLLTPDLARLAALGGFGRLDRAVGRFLSDERLRRVFTFQSLYAGVPPHRALAAYAVIAYMDTVAGVHFPRGGMRALGEALAGAAEKAGADLRYRTAATAVERRGGRVAAVRTGGGERIPCDAVVLTAGLTACYRLLGRAPRRPVPLRYAPSAVVLHLGTDRTWSGLAHHTVSFGSAWRLTFEEITRQGRLMSDPSLLITQSTATDPGLAPDGRHLLSVLAPCPNLRTGGGIRWREAAPRYRDALIRTLEHRGLTGLGDAVAAEHVVTPLDWAASGHAYGTPFALAHTVGQTGPFRPRNLVAGIENAVLAGGGTTPGVGVPSVLVSGRLAAARITGRP
ncbi:phytoene desaturase family protein [Marinitenerispora sediminis]|uniref:Phytoene desaturase n=1 Tax=Marinitenerispora sediminis TaxID=1931232 RepID=A0A368T0B8_9ACTN|nr:phytoene desaturase family protein [Marinitenerispora sediminis]RCV49804.1 phytoene desaturase [Marinitenerispora sediminis]RCV52657.1 phytoene desaturase [Marinitenerispora sediminis]RCV55761.1 phytoene desaturase [Marinitenerispora sediminis]